MSTPRSRRRPEDDSAPAAGVPPEPEAMSPEEPVEPPVSAEESPTTGEDTGVAEAAAPPESQEPESPGEVPPADEPPADQAAEEPPEGVYTAQEPAGPCRMCSVLIDVGDQYMVLNIGRRVHYGDCADQARAAGYLGQIEA